MPELRLIFLTVNEDPDIAAEAIGLGASGYLLKSSASGELFSAIEQALAGKIYITPLVTKRVPLDVFLRKATKPGVEKLTVRQREVLQLLAGGLLTKEIADILHVTADTVVFHKYTIMERLGLKASAELVQYAFEHGMLKRHSYVKDPRGRKVCPLIFRLSFDGDDRRPDTRAPVIQAAGRTRASLEKHPCNPTAAASTRH
jgi:DNA-binding CsgD family transcriptional regulator